MNLKNHAKTLVLLSGLAGVAASAEQAKAQSFDMDCKVILCIAGGFPASCGDAYAYMISRITRWPAPLPPFGFCAMSDGAEYKGHDVDYSFINRGPEAYDCPVGKQLYFREEYNSDDDWQRDVTFCYTNAVTQKTGSGDDERTDIIYNNQSSAQPINFQLKITIEPGTDQEFRSPLFRINTSSGYVSQRVS